MAGLKFSLLRKPQHFRLVLMVLLLRPSATPLVTVAAVADDVVDACLDHVRHSRELRAFGPAEPAAEELGRPGRRLVVPQTAGRFLDRPRLRRLEVRPLTGANALRWRSGRFSRA